MRRSLASGGRVGAGERAGGRTTLESSSLGGGSFIHLTSQFGILGSHRGGQEGSVVRDGGASVSREGHCLGHGTHVTLVGPEVHPGGDRFNAWFNVRLRNKVTGEARPGD